MKRWEYRIGYPEKNEGSFNTWMLNMHGGDGWELVTVLTTKYGSLEYIFKRPLQVSQDDNDQ